MKAAFAANHLYLDSAAISLAPFRRVNSAGQTSRLSRRALLRIEDRAGRIMEATLRIVLGSSLLVALADCVWQIAKN